MEDLIFFLASNTPFDLSKTENELYVEKSDIVRFVTDKKTRVPLPMLETDNEKGVSFFDFKYILQLDSFML